GCGSFGERQLDRERASAGVLHDFLPGTRSRALGDATHDKEAPASCLDSRCQRPGDAVKPQETAVQSLLARARKRPRDADAAAMTAHSLSHISSFILRDAIVGFLLDI